VIGMDTAASTSSQFASEQAVDAYAIPIGKALTIAKQIEAGRSSTTVHVGATAFLGIEVESASSGDGYGYGGGSQSGALVAGVVSGGPADEAGLTQGDVITAIDGRTVTSPSTISGIVLSEKPGATVTVTYVDQTGATDSVSVTLGTGPAQ